VGVQGVRWNRGGTVREGDFNFFYGKGNENHQLGKGFFVHHRIILALQRVGFFFFCGRKSYIFVRGCRYNIKVFNVHETSEEKSDDSKDSP